MIIMPNCPRLNLLLTTLCEAYQILLSLKHLYGFWFIKNKKFKCHVINLSNLHFLFLFICQIYKNENISKMCKRANTRTKNI